MGIIQSPFAFLAVTLQAEILPTSQPSAQDTDRPNSRVYTGVQSLVPLRSASLI